MRNHRHGCSLKTPNEKREILDKRIGKKRTRARRGSGPQARLSISRGYLFEPGRVLTVAFKGGDISLHKDIARHAKTWEKYANIKFDFGFDKKKGKYRSWSRRNKEKKADIRIAFESNDRNSGYWSAIGNDIDYEYKGEAYYPANEPTMNFEDLRAYKKSKQRAFILHEFGHALGFLHEHQSPSGSCQKEFRWNDDEGYIKGKPNKKTGYGPDKNGKNPGIFTVMENEPYFWTRQQVLDNMLMHKNEEAFARTKFDPDSIMKYYYEPWMYIKGEKSKCYSPKENTKLSELDKIAAGEAYPFD